MTVPGRGDGDSGGEVEELVAIHILDDDAASALGYQGVGAGVGGRDEAGIVGDDALGIGAGKLGADDGAAGEGENRGHGFLLKLMASRI